MNLSVESFDGDLGNKYMCGVHLHVHTLAALYFKQQHNS